MSTFIVELWSKILSILGIISLFWLIRKLIPALKRNIVFSDAWVLGHLMLAIGVWGISSIERQTLGVGWLLIYGGFRIFEVFIYQVNVLLFDHYRAGKNGTKYAVRGFLRLIILLLHNYVEFIFWFAAIYLNFDWVFRGGNAMTSFESLNFSFVTMTTFGHSQFLATATWGHIVQFGQSIIGLFMALVIIARFIALIPSPETLDELEKQ
jgi:hypothetical protein